MWRKCGRKRSLLCELWPSFVMKEEGRRKKEEGRRKKEEGRGKREEGRGKKEEGRGYWCQLKVKPLVRQGLKPPVSKLKSSEED
ncbi:hypothetical protein BCD67_06500 [Oscillatoriales cyanobacterium USR001]|nr:hypothetical protein BCD67_06500 [Oscillatoriales cyanobacterium USR001]